MLGTKKKKHLNRLCVQNTLPRKKNPLTFVLQWSPNPMCGWTEIPSISLGNLEKRMKCLFFNALSPTNFASPFQCWLLYSSHHVFPWPEAVSDWGYNERNGRKRAEEGLESTSERRSDGREIEWKQGHREFGFRTPFPPLFARSSEVGVLIFSLSLVRFL